MTRSEAIDAIITAVESTGLNVKRGAHSAKDAKPRPAACVYSLTLDPTAITQNKTENYLPIGIDVFVDDIDELDAKFNALASALYTKGGPNTIQRHCTPGETFFDEAVKGREPVGFGHQCNVKYEAWSYEP